MLRIGRSLKKTNVTHREDRRHPATMKQLNQDCVLEDLRGPLLRLVVRNIAGRICRWLVSAQLEISRLVDTIRMVLSADEKVLVILLVHEPGNTENARSIRCSVVAVEFASNGAQ